MKLRNSFSELHPAKQLIFFISLVAVCLIVANVMVFIFGYLIWGDSIMALAGLEEIDLENSVNISMLKFLQIINQLGLFILPVFLFGFLVSNKSVNYLYLDKRPGLSNLLLAAGILIVGLPFLSWMIEVNESMKLPEYMAGLEKWMQSSQEQNDSMIKRFLASTSLGGLTTNLIMIAVLPALGEEIFFRGILQKVFLKLRNSPMMR